MIDLETVKGVLSALLMAIVLFALNWLWGANR